MTDVVIGEGRYDGKGVYAARDFEEGEIVIPFNLKELEQEEFNLLPEAEKEWTHSYWGRIFLFPEPARYVNHYTYHDQKSPTTTPDLEKMADIALRPIKKGEAITIDNNVEIRNELETYLKAYEKAANGRDFKAVDPLISDDATFYFTNGTFKGKDAIKKAFEDTWENIKEEKYSISNVEWLVADYWHAVCTYEFRSDGLVNGERQVYEGLGTNVLKRIDGSWRLVHEHLSGKN